jgi:hypothetical protein
VSPTHRVVPVLVAVFASIAAACTGDGISISVGGSASSTPSVSASQGVQLPAELGVEPVHTGAATSAGAMKALCISPESVSTSEGQSPPPTPPSIAEVQDQVEAVRGLDFLKPVEVQPVTEEEIAAKLTDAFDSSYPKRFYDRRTVAWHTMGLIPSDVTIREATLAFQTGGVVGFYNPLDGELVYIGDDQLDQSERFTLAHELTHAIDDQNFDLSRLDPIAGACRDEAFQAALGVVEGSAQFFASRVMVIYPDPDADLGGGGGLPEGIPPFMLETTLWPYSAGPAFIDAIGGTEDLEAVDRALTNFPVTTEQVIHPERYPDDVPTPMDVGDLSARLGPAWGDLDVMEIGEEFLRAMLNVHLDEGTAIDAAAGWDGGVYRAWTDGREAAVLLRTAWDSEDDARAFENAVASWFDEGDGAGWVSRTGVRVDVGFATSTRVSDHLLDASGAAPAP